MPISYPNQVQREALQAATGSTNPYISDLMRSLYAIDAVNDEIAWLQRFLADHGVTTTNRYRSDLYRMAVEVIGLPATDSLVDSKRAFWGSSIPRLYQRIKSLPGLVAYYPLNETAGEIARNCAPATRGTHNGTITGATIGQAGKVGRAYSLDGVNDFINVTSSSVLDGFNAMTLGIFVKLGGTIDDADCIFAKDGVYRIILLSSVIQFQFGTTNNAWATTLNTGIAYAGYQNVWSFQTITYDKDAGSDNLKYLINGSQVSQQTRTGAFVTNSNSLTIGSGSTSQRFVNGHLQNFFIVNRALSVAEILNIARIAGVA